MDNSNKGVNLSVNTNNMNGKEVNDMKSKTCKAPIIKLLVSDKMYTLENKVWYHKGLEVPTMEASHLFGILKNEIGIPKQSKQPEQPIQSEEDIDEDTEKREAHFKRVGKAYICKTNNHALVLTDPVTKNRCIICKATCGTDLSTEFVLKRLEKDSEGNEKYITKLHIERCYFDKTKLRFIDPRTHKLHIICKSYTYDQDHTYDILQIF